MATLAQRRRMDADLRNMPAPSFEERPTYPQLPLSFRATWHDGQSYVTNRRR